MLFSPAPVAPPQHRRNHWCHTIPNAVICVTALLHSDGVFGLGVCRAVQPCFDTDCNGATVGSILGMMHGTDGIDSRRTEPLDDTLHTTLQGHDTVQISNLADLSFRLYGQIRKQSTV